MEPLLVNPQVASCCTTASKEYITCSYTYGLRRCFDGFLRGPATILRRLMLRVRSRTLSGGEMPKLVSRCRRVLGRMAGTNEMRAGVGRIDSEMQSMGVVSMLESLQCVFTRLVDVVDRCCDAINLILASSRLIHHVTVPWLHR